MTFWTTLAAPMAVTVLWAFGPGLIATSALRLRPTLRWALSPLVSFGIIALSAMIAPRLGLGWGPLPVILGLLVVGGIAWIVRILTTRGDGRWPTDPRRMLARLRQRSWRSLLVSREVLTGAALALAAVVMLQRLRTAMVRPDAISQTYDGIFHLSLVRWFLDHDSASMLTASAMVSGEDRAGFYPAVWHATVALTNRTLGGGEIAVQTNAMTLVACALVWPAAALLFTRALLPSRMQRAGMLPAAIVVVSMPLFPFLMLSFGVLYPNLLGMSMAPALLLVAARLVGMAPTEKMSVPAIILVGVLGSLGLALAHPNAAMSLIVFAIPLCIVAAVRAVVRVLTPRTRSRRAVATLAVAGTLAVAVPLLANLLWPIVRPNAASLTWMPFTSEQDAIMRGVFAVGVFGAPSLTFAVLTLIGLYAAVRNRRATVLLMWLVAMHLWIAVAAWPDGAERDYLVGPWYNDPPRLAALLGVPAALVIALGVSHVAARAGHAIPALLRQYRSSRDVRTARSNALAAPGRASLLSLRSWALVSVTILCAVVLAPLMRDTPAMDRQMYHNWEAYRFSADSPLLTTDELALIQRIPDEIPADAVVITDAANGSSLLYPYTGIRTSDHHASGSAEPAQAIVNQNLDDLHYMPEVCAAIEDLGADYVLDFGRDQINNGKEPRPGWFGLTEKRGFEEVDREGSAVLYRIPDC